LDRWRFPEVRLEQSPQSADNSGKSAIPPVFSLLSLGHSLGAVPAPGGASMFCFVRHGERPSGLGFQQQISRAENKNTLEISCRSLRRKHISALGAGHTRVASRKSVPSEIRAKTNMEEIIMALYENTIRLKGFIGKNAQAQATANGKSVIVLSLATKSSYKDKKTGAWVARTEWHRIVCFAKPAEYAKGLKKGDYVEVEGELRSSEFDAEVGNGKQKTQVKRRNWEVRASLVKKLARPQHSETDTESISEEDAA
jgi:single-strand DNA-binding protein